MPTLFLVATPIGNLADITLRALDTLRGVSLIAAEDTRTARKLLSRYDIHTPLVSYHDRNKAQRIPYLLKELEERDVALVSEAGTPAISDPGYELLLAALKNGVSVVPIPGPSIVLTALSVSGLPTDQFTYLGFLPRRAAARRRLLASLAHSSRTLVAFEAPHRIQETLQDLLATLGDRPIAVCRELTKLHEEVFRGTVSQALAHFQQPRGEFTLVIEGARQEAEASQSLSQPLRDAAAQELALLRAQGLRAKEAVPIVASSTGLPRRQVYQLWLRAQKG
ncbi:MAG: 16S rRNA (cytidine(1402)-2'-O)-methyltransferase [Chloroflexi bacterium]|nr:16S rRNA (cytidine(1402)-2'-O)-methyltransferase [Chloroflexota bacterium]